MEYQIIINLLENSPNQPTKFRTKNWVEINNEGRGKYTTNSQIKFKTSMFRSSLCDYSDLYILVKGTITIARVAAPSATDNAGKKAVFQNCVPFTDCISEINKYIMPNALM